MGVHWAPPSLGERWGIHGNEPVGTIPLSPTAGKECLSRDSLLLSHLDWPDGPSWNQPGPPPSFIALAATTPGQVLAEEQGASEEVFFFSPSLFLVEELTPPPHLYPTWRAPRPLQCLGKPSAGPDLPSVGLRSCPCSCQMIMKTQVRPERTRSGW